MAERKGRPGLTGKDKQQRGLRGVRGGVSDPVTDVEKRRPGEDKERVVQEPALSHDTDNLPEGLKRPPKGPVGPRIGRRAGNK